MADTTVPTEPFLQRQPDGTLQLVRLEKQSDGTLQLVPVAAPGTRATQAKGSPGQRGRTVLQPAPAFAAAQNAPKTSGSGYTGSWAGEAARNQTTPAGTSVAGGNSIADLESFVRTNYGYMAGFLDIPEVRTVLLEAARQGWDSTRLYGALTATTWWKTSSASSRQWQQLMSEDPATAQQQAATNAATISDIAKTHGLNLSGAQIGDLAVKAAQYGWSDTQTLDAILKNVSWEGVQGGQLTATVDDIKRLSGKYLMPISDQTARDWSLRIARGEMTEAGVESIVMAQAKARWSYIPLEQGVTPADYFAPARDTIASTLEVGSDTIDMLDPKWMKMLEVRDPKSGELRAATMNEAMLSARSMPQWAGTKNAQELTASAGRQLMASFGRR